MATWRADLFVNSRVGRITTEVEAATFSGAKEQIYAKHGNVQQITNLREVRNSNGSQTSSGDYSGLLPAIAILFVLGLIVTYWYIAVPVLVLIAILYFYGKSND
jgi:hypothetical protein